MKAVWNEGFEFCELDDRITISCPKDEQFGLTVRMGLSWVSSEVSTRSMIVVSFVAGDWGRLATACSTSSFFTAASACVLRMLRSGGDLVIVDTVLLVGVVDMKSAAENEAAMIKTFVCPGDCVRNIRLSCSSEVREC